MTKNKLLKLKQTLVDNKEAFEGFGGDICAETNCDGVVSCSSHQCITLQLDAKIKVANKRRK